MKRLLWRASGVVADADLRLIYVPHLIGGPEIGQTRHHGRRLSDAVERFDLFHLSIRPLPIMAVGTFFFHVPRVLLKNAIIPSDRTIPQLQCYRNKVELLFQ